MVEREVPSIAILASGSGSTAEACIRATQNGTLGARVGLVVCNNPPHKAGIYERVSQLNSEIGLAIPVLHISGITHPGGAGNKGEQTFEESQAISYAVDQAGCVLVALMGYMKKIRGPLLQAYGWDDTMHSAADARMLNTHPGPLPQTEGLYGKRAQAAVLESGLGYSAHTVHTVTDAYDQGMIIQETRVPVEPGDTPDSLFDRVQAVEKRMLPHAINMCLEQRGVYGDS